jgi:ribosomal protein S17
MKNRELIYEIEWYRRLCEENEYVVVSCSYNKIVRVFEKKTSKLYDVNPIKIGDKIMIELKELE